MSRIMYKDVVLAGAVGTAKQLKYDNSSSNLESHNTQDAIDEVLEKVLTNKSNVEDIISNGVNHANVSDSCSGNSATATSAGNVTGVVAIANGGTGATTVAGAYQNLHPTNHGTGIAYVSGMGSSGYSGGGGYATIAQLKQAMGLNNVNNTADSAKRVSYATSAGTCTGNAATATRLGNYAAGNYFVNGYAPNGQLKGMFGFDSEGKPCIIEYDDNGGQHFFIFSKSGINHDGDLIT